MADAEEPKDEMDTPSPENNGLPDKTIGESDPETDSAIDDIIRKEGDDELQAQDVAAAQPVVMKLGLWERFKNAQINWWGSPGKRWLTILSSLVLIGGLFGWPVTRYDILGLYFRGEVTVEVVDSKSGAPVSGAQVQLDGTEADTNAEGLAVLSVHTGRRQLTVSKKYYSGDTQLSMIMLSPGSNVFEAKLSALGRELEVKVVNKITGVPVEGAEVTASGASARTNGTGVAMVVLPSDTVSQPASVTVGGFITDQVTINAGANLAANTFSVTPSGKLYFLSKASGTIDVVKTNLDGTDRQTVLPGTGSEDPSETSLLVSSDWKYLSLLSRRTGTNASLYLIDTTNGDKLTAIDQGNAQYTPLGWSGDRFIYEVDQSGSVPIWQTGQVQLKSFDPTSGQSLLLDQTQSSGSNSTNWLTQTFGNVYSMGNQVVYTKGWLGSNAGMSGFVGKSAELDVISSDGTSHKVVDTFGPVPAGSSGNQINLETAMYEPGGLYIDYNFGGQAGFYTYQNGNVTPDTTLTETMFSQTPYPIYLSSPSGSSTFWAQQRNGMNTLLTGDANGNNQKQVAGVSSFNPFGWYSDNYLLVTESNSDLYIMSASGGAPFKVSDYYKPPSGFAIYNGNYGGV